MWWLSYHIKFGSVLISSSLEISVPFLKLWFTHKTEHEESPTAENLQNASAMSINEGIRDCSLIMYRKSFSWQDLLKCYENPTSKSVTKLKPKPRTETKSRNQKEKSWQKIREVKLSTSVLSLYHWFQSWLITQDHQEQLTGCDFLSSLLPHSRRTWNLPASPSWHDRNLLSIDVQAQLAPGLRKGCKMCKVTVEGSEPASKVRRRLLRGCH